jgi:Endonuclease NucS
MAFEMALWRVAGKQLERLAPTRLDQEQRLEDWIYEDSSVLGLEVAVIGRQVQTAYGGRIDLLGIDRDGNCMILELKRDRTPRDIVGQVLDYAAWIKDLGYAELDQICQNQRHMPLTEFYQASFGQVMPETVNDSHSMVVIASELDDSSERIINYLSENCGVNINALFFRFFKGDGAEHLGRAWLKNPEEVVQRADDKKRVPWSGYWFANVGEGEHRTWEDNVKYGFISAGHDDRYSKPLLKLGLGDELFAYMAGLGYVGYGKVTKVAVPIAQFQLADGSRLLDQPLKAPRASEDADDPKLSDWAVGVEWQEWVPKERSKTFKGVFANQNIICKLRHPETVAFLRREFLHETS